MNITSVSALNGGSSCHANSVNFRGNNVMPTSNPIDSAGVNFDDAMAALASAAKALMNAKKAEGAKNEALTREKIEAKFLSMQDSKPVNYEDLYDMGYGIGGGENHLCSRGSDKLNPSIFKGKDTVVIGISEDRKSYTCEKYTEYDRKGRPVASIQKITNKTFPTEPDYKAIFFKYKNDYSSYSEMTMYKCSAIPEESQASHPKAALTVGHYI